MTASPCRWEGETLVLFLQLQPKASRSEFAGLHGERYKLRIQAPPIDGRANLALLEFLAGVFGVPRARVTLRSGEGARQKTVAIDRPGTLPPWPGLPAGP